MQVSIVKVNGVLWNGDADSLTAPGTEGELTVLPHHVPLVTTLKEGRVVVKREGAEVFTQEVESGVLEITGESVIVLL